MIQAPVTDACDAICQFSRLEPTVQGALIGAGSALLAAILTVAITGVVTAIQLWHARSERTKDRSLEIKKDILLQMLDGIASSRTAINQIINFDLPLSDVQETFNQGNRNAQRAHAVASIPIISALQNYNEESSIIFIELMKNRIDIDVAKRNLDKKENEMNKLVVLHDELSLRNRNFFLEGSQNTEALERIGSLVRKNGERISEVGKEYEIAASEFDVLFDPFSSVCVEAQLKLHPFVQKLTHLVRLEVGVDRKNSTEYIEASKVNVVRIRKTIRAAESESDVKP